MRGSTAAAEIALRKAQEYLDARELSAAVLGFDYAEACGAEEDQCSAGRWFASMLMGKFEAAWKESDAICARGRVDPHRFWRGEDIHGKHVVLRCLHGLGDAVQFLRYAPALREKASRLTVQVPPPLVDLVPMFAGVEDVVTWGELGLITEPIWDVQMEINELPYFFRTTAADLPVATRYLLLPKQLLRTGVPVARWESSLRVGVVWASGEWKPSRSIPLRLLKPVLRTSGCEFWNLAGGASRAEWEELEDNGNLHEAAFCANSIVKLAALVAQLDLIITSDTLAVHLAGALGTPAWLLLEYAADWRWPQARSDSPWYPSLRLFRQKRRGSWEEVVGDVQSALYAHLRLRNHSSLVA